MSKSISTYLFEDSKDYNPIDHPYIAAPTEPKKPETREERGLGAQPMSDINAPASTPPKDWKAKEIETATKLGKDSKDYNPIDHPYIAGAGALGLLALKLAYDHQHKKDIKEKEKIAEIDPKFNKADYIKEKL